MAIALARRSETRFPPRLTLQDCRSSPAKTLSSNKFKRALNLEQLLPCFLALEEYAGDAVCKLMR